MTLLSFTPETDWQCGACNEPLTPRAVDVSYMGNTFNVELLVCARCGQVFVPEDLALGRMLEVEQLLEDK